ncbi:MAG TPA: MauE/DoxX family redox-associated membrane protein [Gaiellaceae bacterium]|nr:MauE/DoxX family redox-associated membrane protein [Gaiellaceae bacterium]
MAVAAVVFRFGLAVVFLLSGLAKLPRRAEFTQAVRNYRLVPERLGSVIGKVLPPVEVAAGVLLALGLGVRPVAGLLGLFLVGFSGAVAINLLRGRTIDCGCFGPVAQRRITWLTVARNVVLIAAAAVVVAVGPTALALDRYLPGTPSPKLSAASALALLLATSLAVVLATLAQEVHRLASLVRAAEERSAQS